MNSSAAAPAHSLSSLAGRLLAALFLSSLFTCAASAQSGTWSATDATTPTSLAPGAPAGSYALSGIDNVNLYNGNLNFTLPLLNVGGRGAAGYVIQLPVEIKWTEKHVPPPPQCGPTGCQPSQQEETKFATPNGWNTRPRYSLGSIFGRNAADPGSHITTTGSGGTVVCDYYTSTLTRLTFVGPDGTEFEMHDQLNGGKPLSQTCQTTPLRGKVFVTRDGTSATFISDIDIYDGGSAQFSQPLSGYLITSDGTRRRIVGGNVVWLVDRNGNRLTVTYDSNNVLVTAITDSLNRQVTITYATSTTPYDTISFKGYGGATRTIRLYYASLSSVLRTGFSIQTFLQLFPNLNGSSSSQFNPSNLLSAVELPDGRRYTFKYNSYAELARVDLPTGGHFEYDFLSAGGAPLTATVYHELSQRRVYLDATSTSLQSKTDYSPAVDDLNGHSIRTVDQRNAAGALLAREKHYLHGVPYSDPTINGAYQTVYSSPAEGREYKTESYDDDGTTLLRKVEHTWTLTAGTNGSPSINPRVTQTLTTLADTNQVAKQTFNYDQYNNRTDVYEYNYGAGAAGSLVRHTHTDYLTSNVVGGTTYNYDTDTSIHLRNLPEQTSVFNASGVEQARTTYEYDDYTATANHAALAACPGISGLDSAYTTAKKTRGNVTAVTLYLLTSGTVTGSVSSYQKYDVAGNVIRSIDGRGFVTTIYYTDRYGAPDDNEARSNSAPSELGTQLSYAFPSQVTNPANHTSFTQRDYYTGQAVNAEDPNGTVSSASYDDLLDRPTKVVSAADDPTLSSQKTFAYDDTARVITTTSDLTNYTDGLLKSQTVYDGLGRTAETRKYETATTYVMTKTTYDALGRVSRVSNPYRTGTPSWTETAYDALGRAVSVKTLDDNAVVTTGYSGNTVTVTDQAGKDRQSTTDALGRLTQVVEDPGGLAYVTTYAYDTLDNLKTVTQTGLQNGASVTETRTFTYDSLSRLLSATNPESGTISYEYDNNGNLTKKVDPRFVPGSTTTKIETTYTYDAINRVATKSYNDSTPDVTCYYDAQTLPTGAPSFSRGASVGKLVAVLTTGTTAGTYYGYDGLGQVLRRTQRTDSVTYIAEATYNKAGGLLTETRPAVPNATDRRTVTYTYDGAGRLLSLNSNATTYATGASVSNITYAPHGALDKETLGNSLVHDINYNTRLQPTQIRLGTSTTPTSALDLTYNYGTTANNGDLLDVTEKIGTWTAKQIYTYDALNRLDTTTETNGSTTTYWTEDNDYDRFGNRRELIGGVPSMTFNNKNRVAGYTYDAAGNVTDDTAHTYDYDAENRMKTVDAEPNVYVYDGEGDRVRKYFSQGDQVRFVYGVSGELVAEFNAATGAWEKEYIYGSDGVAATVEPAVGTKYTTDDHLGSARVVTNGTGGVTSRHDYQPFGQELMVGDGGRTAGQFFGVNDNLKQKFTQYERDDETGLDYAQARYYGSTQGRFTSPDPYKIVAEIKYEKDAEKARNKLNQYLLQPQQWNSYAYSLNNPLKYTDPTGEEIWLRGSPEDQQEALNLIREILGDERFKYVKLYNHNGPDGKALVLNIDPKDVEAFSKIGDDADNKTLSQGMAEILSSSEVVEGRVDGMFINRKGELRDTYFLNMTTGGHSIAASDSSTGHQQVVLDPSGVSYANSQTDVTKRLSSDGEPLKFTGAMIFAHELGHAWDRMRGHGGDEGALAFENAMRSRIPNNKQRRVAEQ